MSTAPENEFDLEKLFLPAWAQEPSSAKQYAQYEGREERSLDRGPSRGRPQQRRQGGVPGARRDEGRPRQDRGGPPRSKGAQDRAAGGDRPGPGPCETRSARAPLEA